MLLFFFFLTWENSKVHVKEQSVFHIAEVGKQSQNLIRFVEESCNVGTARNRDQWAADCISLLGSFYFLDLQVTEVVSSDIDIYWLSS